MDTRKIRESAPKTTTFAAMRKANSRRSDEPISGGHEKALLTMFIGHKSYPYNLHNTCQL